MNLFDEPIQPVSSNALGEHEAAALADRMLNKAADIVANSDALKRVQDYKKDASKALIPALLNMMAAGYTGHQQAVIIKHLASIDESLKRIADKHDDIAEATDFIAASQPSHEG
ncbi:hypothetical protein SAMN05192560_0808 [Methylobacillus rhizosphaerae]|uniref:Uncharacterized protein n=1 Tax=Methylobacillus rhizosphaerae TaxID=551994 RepID=A0A238YU65_9PROT|nr:hypothetical protein [Methylobacillus rhizosphaerae]SNR74113.1 hypothetical protein SAMN05192560_0808 [Methylobacillus rhizosphaerae]